MRKAKVYEALSILLSAAFLALFVIGLVLVYRFFFYGLYSTGSKTQSVGAIAIVTFALWMLLSCIEELDEAENKALNAEYKQVVYSGLMARGEDERDAE